MPRTLVTGGAGFLGSHLCDRLLQAGHEVVCMDNLITGDERNVAHLQKNPRFTFVRHDVTEYIDLPGKVDHVLHFASPASPSDYMKYPIQTLKVGALGTHNVLGLAKDKNACFMLASTSEVYGDPDENPQNEDYWGNVNPVGPRGVYDEAKRFAEAMAMAYHRCHGVNTRIARIFNTYGPRMRSGDGRAVPNFICQALRGEDITVYGNGGQTRSFCYYTDLIEGIFRLLHFHSEVPDVHTPVNLGNPAEITILEVARLIKDLARSQSKIVFEPLPDDDPRVRRPEITKARELLGWEPRVGLKDGLEATLEYFRGALARVSGGAPADMKSTGSS